MYFLVQESDYKRYQTWDANNKLLARTIEMKSLYTPED